MNDRLRVFIDGIFAVTVIVTGMHAVRDAAWWRTSHDPEVRQVARTRRRGGLALVALGTALLTSLLVSQFLP